MGKEGMRKEYTPILEWEQDGEGKGEEDEDNEGER